jgi:hypothetical protein
MSRARRYLVLAAAALLAGAALRGVLALAEAVLEAKLRQRIVAGAARRGVTASIGNVRVRLPFRARLSDVRVAGHGASAALDRVDVRVGLFGRGALGRLRRVELGRLAVEAPQGLSVRVAPTAWDVSAKRGVVVLAGREGEGRIALGRKGAGGVRVGLDSLDLKRLVVLRRNGAFVGDLGVVSGVVAAGPVPGAGLSVEANLVSRRVRLAAPPEDDPPGAAALGEPFDAEGSVAATLWRDARYVEVACASGSAAGLRARAGGVFAFAPRDAWFDLELSVPRLELARLLAASGLDLPAGEGDLGSAELEARVTGRMLDPKSFVVDQRLDFRPPARPLPELERFRGPFRREMTGRDGQRTRVAVDPADVDFVPLDEVPAHFVRGLLTSEDASFWSHSGLDLGEVPVAMSINWVRGTRSRGASTITQQLAKNLFLTRERSYRRKLQEAALALLLEPALGKRRILEVYLNVIEWGPGLHGLGPASRHYFGKHPSELSPREGAFLVALIPGPVKYQSSFASGVLSPGFSRLVNGVLYRLRSVGVLTDEELEAELAEPLRLLWTPPDVAGEEEPGASEEDLALPEVPPEGRDDFVGPPASLRPGTLRGPKPTPSATSSAAPTPGPSATTPVPSPALLPVPSPESPTFPPR